MKYYNKLNRFPLGAIKAEGFLKDQLLRGKDGMAGNLYKLEPEMIADPWVDKKYVPTWAENNQSGWGGEISGNYWTGYIQHAFILNDPQMIERATKWVEDVLKNQKDDGYLGTYFEEDADIYDDFNAWSTACGMRGLLAFYEATGRKDVFDAVLRCMLWFCENWAGDKKTTYGAPYIIEIMVYCYKITNDERLLQFAEDFAEFQCTKSIYPNSYRAFLDEDFHYSVMHTAGVGVTVRLPALLYSVTGKEEYLKASEKYIESLRKNAIHLSGAPVSVSEFLGPVGMNTESEYCNFAYFNASYAYLSYITGNSKYGDYMEEMFYNAAQGARKKDEKAIAYLSAPNQIYATNESSTATVMDQVYAPCVVVACCPVNAVAVVPEFIRDMMFYDNGNNIYVSCYGPCKLNYNGINIEQRTNYPFRNNSEFIMRCSGEFSMFLKIPSWANGYKITINGEETTALKNENGYAEIRRNWQENDLLKIEFSTTPEVIKVDDSAASSKFPIAIKYGALLYSYHIPEIWNAFPGNPTTPLPDGWSWFNVMPIYNVPSDGDFHEDTGRRRDAISWNIVLDEELKPEDITIEELPTDGYAWEKPFIKLHTHCYKAPYLYPPYPVKTLEPAKSKHEVTQKLPLILEPYGCTNLRITYFPRADLKK